MNRKFSKSLGTLLVRAAAGLLGLALLGIPLEAQVNTVGEPSVMMPGDQLVVVVYRNTELSGTYTITSEGTLLHPLFSQVEVARVPVAEARDRMAEELRKHLEEPLFTFEPRYRVYVGGQVRLQGEHHLADMTVGQAIVNAGGSTTPNREYRVRLIRGDQVVVANLDAESERELLQTRVRSGDQILVEQRPSFNRNVLGPGLQVLQTVTALIATFVYFDAILGSD
jgi:protein involved in polysaccharide export with SLBB domain